MKTLVQISNRHAHLTKKVYKKLFGNTNIMVKRYLNQKGEYASFSKIDIEYNGKVIKNITVVGPFRKYNQVELLKSDLEFLEIDEYVRKSSDIEGTPGITLIKNNNKVTISQGVIRSQRHIHMNKKTAKKIGVSNNEKVIVNNLFDAYIKVSKNGYYELHIDKDEAKEFNLSSGDEIEFKKI